jgi:hypothetical protein
MKSAVSVKAKIKVGPKRVMIQIEIPEKVATLLRKRLEKQHGVKVQ